MVARPCSAQIDLYGSAWTTIKCMFLWRIYVILWYIPQRPQFNSFRNRTSTEHETTACAYCIIITRCHFMMLRCKLRPQTVTVDNIERVTRGFGFSVIFRPQCSQRCPCTPRKCYHGLFEIVCSVQIRKIKVGELCWATKKSRKVIAIGILISSKRCQRSYSNKRNKNISNSCWLQKQKVTVPNDDLLWTALTVFV